MFDSCGVQHLLCFGCLGWAWKRCAYTGAEDSSEWPLADADDFRPIPRICRRILACYEDDIWNPKWAPPGGYGLNPDWLVKRVTCDLTTGQCPPYLIYLDHDHREIVLAIRGLNLASESDYYILLNNRLGMQMFDGGYAHHGLVKSAVWLLDQECETLKRLWVEAGSCYRIVFAGHSLGSGVAALMGIIAVNHLHKLGGMPRSLIRVYAVAPARCVSLNLAIRYADVIHSVILQDDFLPRTSTPLEDHFRMICCMPCFFFTIWMRDLVIPASRRLRDPRRLYPPGRLYHIVERKFCRIGRFPPVVKVACPVDKRFEYVVLSCNASSDHEIVWIEREAQKALDRMGNFETTKAPVAQKFEGRKVQMRGYDEEMADGKMVQGREVQMRGDEEEMDSSSHVQPNEEIGAAAAKGTTNWDELIDKLIIYPH